MNAYPSSMPWLLLTLVLGLPISAAAKAPIATDPASQADKADLVLRGGRILTFDDQKPEVEALAARGDRLVALGTQAEISRWIGPKTRVIELGGRFAIPGFIEGHGHFLSLGLFRTQLDLTHARSWEEIVALVAERVKTAKPGEWILGRGWHQEKWQHAPEPSVEGFPLHASLSAVSPENPVLLEHASGHATFANARAMAQAGITSATPAPAGGEILHDAAGEPIGLFRENAAALVERRGDPSPAEVLAAIELATRECWAKGVTSFEDAGTSVEVADSYRQLDAEGKLGVRLWIMLSDPSEKLAREMPRIKSWAKTPFFAVGAIKRWMDGALGSHGAWLLAPYADLPKSTGLATLTPQEAEASARLAIESGLQLAVHAIGDRANRETLDLFARTFARYPQKQDLRWRIEHAQHLDPADIPRFAQLGVIASMQTVHATSDGPWVPARLGDERTRAGAYVWRKLISSGATLVNGTDVPVEDLDPIANLAAAVNRRLPDGRPFYADQHLTVIEALRAATYNAAYAAFQEKDKGSLAAGKLADVTVLSQDLLRIPTSAIEDTRVLYTIVGGKVVYEAK